VLLLGVAIVARWISSPRLLFVAQMGFLTVGLCITPTVAYKLTKHRGAANEYLGEMPNRPMARAVAETLLFIAIILGFGLWVVGKPILGIWTVYAVATVVLLEFGSHFLKWYQASILERLLENELDADVESASHSIRTMFRYERILYIPVPVGLVAGTIIGLFRHQVPESTIILCIQLVLLGASLILLCLLVYAFVRMSDALFRRRSSAGSRVSIEELRGGNGPSSHVYRVIARSSEPDVKNSKSRDYGLANIVTSLRNMYFYDALHNLLLLVAFIAILANLWSIGVDIQWFAAGAVIATLMLNQLPYVIGQWQLHQQVLSAYKDIERKDMEEDLRKYAPLFPKWEVLSALIAPVSGGGLLFILFTKLLENTLM
jgi:hypothetical protein